jgi:hypothetical protein
MCTVPGIGDIGNKQSNQNLCPPKIHILVWKERPFVDRDEYLKENQESHSQSVSSLLSY